MSDQRINLAELLERLKWLHVHSRLSNSDYPAVMALVEAVEAAHALDATPLLNFDNQLWTNLSDALARFEWGSNE